MPTSVAVTSRELAEIHRAAQERLGLTGAVLMLEAWGEVNAIAPTMSAAWFAKLFAFTSRIRKLSRRLAARYYNLARAIATGTAYPDIDGGFSGDHVRLGTLYQEMADVLNEVVDVSAVKKSTISAAENIEPPRGKVDDPTPSREERLDDEFFDQLQEMFNELFPEENSPEWNAPISIDEPENWDWPDENDDDSNALLEKLIREEALEALKRDAQRELEKENSGREKTVALQQRLDAKGSIAAGVLDRDIMSSGRRVIRQSGLRDKRRKAWMRITGPHPCSFCAMLASRGAVYKSEKSAGGDGNMYHANCHCHVVPVWTDNWAYSKRDQYFIDNWPKVTKGYSGNGALNAWRRWLSSQYKLQLVPDQDVYFSDSAIAA